MNTDQQLRDQLSTMLDSKAEAITPLDTDALIATGARRVRGRRLATIAGAGACALVMGLGVAHLGGLTPSVTPAAPTPTVSTSAQVAPSTVRLTLPVAQLGTRTVDAAEIDVAITSEGRLAATATAADGTIIDLGESTDPVTAARSTVIRHGDLVVAAIPRGAVQASLLPDGSYAGYTQEMAPLRGTDFAAVAFRLSDLSRPVDSADVLWWTSDGTPFSSHGAGTSRQTTSKALEVVSPDRQSTISRPGGVLSVWILPKDHLMGLRGPSGSSMTIDDGGIGPQDASEWLDDATQTPTQRMGRHSLVYLLHGNVSDVTAQWVEAAQDQTLDVVAWPEVDRTAVFVSGDIVGDATDDHANPKAFTGISWTDEAGQRQSVKV